MARHDTLAHLSASGASGTSGTWRFLEGEEETTVDVRAVFRSTALLVLRDAAVAGMGVALLPDWLVAGEVAAGALERLLPGYTTPVTPLYALHRAELRGAARVRAFLEHLRAAFGA